MNTVVRVMKDDENDTWLMEEHQNTPPAETPKNPNAVALGRLGGRAGRGPSKARTTEQARAAVTVRWNRKRLEYLRQELRAERISYEELAELQGLVPFIDPSDTELLEAAGVPEKH